jgi:peroxiredoxin
MNTKCLTAACLTSFLLFGCQASKVSQSISEGKKTPAVEVPAIEVADKPKYQEFIQAGDLLPLSKIKNLEGDLVDLESGDKRKLVILFATWCSDSNRALKALNQSELLSDESIEIIAIAREESEATVKAWRDKFDIKVPLAVDSDRSIYKQFAVGGIPRIITVSKDNKIIKMNLAEGENQLDLIEWH